MAQENQSSERSSNYMLEEFRFLKSSFEGAMAWRDERFKSFVNIIFGTTALLAIIAQLSQANTELFYSITIIGGILYLYGLFVFSRLIAGSLGIERYRRAINRVRNYFVDLDKDLEEYLVVPVENHDAATKKRRLGWGLLGTTALTNSLLLLVSGTTLLASIIGWHFALSAVIGVVLAAISWILHAAYYRAQAKQHVKTESLHRLAE
jgi:hypothetical protein